MFRAVTWAISRSTASLKLSFLNGSPPQRPHFSTSNVWASRLSSVPYHAMKRAGKLSQWISNVRSRLGGREKGRTLPESDPLCLDTALSRLGKLGDYSRSRHHADR